MVLLYILVVMVLLLDKNNGRPIASKPIQQIQASASFFGSRTSRLDYRKTRFSLNKSKHASPSQPSQPSRFSVSSKPSHPRQPSQPSRFSQSNNRFITLKNTLSRIYFLKRFRNNSEPNTFSLIFWNFIPNYMCSLHVVESDFRITYCCFLNLVLKF